MAVHGHGGVESDDQIQSVVLSRYTTLIPVTTQFRKSLNHQRGFHCKNKCLNTSLNAWGFPKCQLVCVLHVWQECCYIRQTVWNWWFSCFEIWLWKMFTIGCGWTTFFAASINSKLLPSKCTYKVNTELHKSWTVVDVLLCRIYNESVKSVVDGHL